VVKAYLGLGSNLGDREATLRSARQALERTFPGARFSSLYETEPLVVTDQPWFLNQVAEIDTELPPMGLLEYARELEGLHGRLRTVPKGPRTLDVDILLYGELVHREPVLELPHPGILHRKFVLVPLAELAGDRVLPGLGLTVRDALKKTTDAAQVRPAHGGTVTC